MKKRILLTIAIATALVTLVGCGNNENATIVNGEETATEEGTEVVEEDIDANEYVTAADYSEITVSMAPKQEVTEEILDSRIESVLRSNSYYGLITDRAAEDGDLVEITYVGTIDGEEFDSGTIGADGSDFTLGAGTTIDGFEEAIVGMSVGEQKIAEVPFPEDYAATDLAGKDAQFDITLVAIKELLYPEELTEEMITAANADCTTEEELREAIRAELEESYAESYDEELRYSAIEVLINESDFAEDLPESMIAEYETAVLADAEQYAAMYGVSLEDFVTMYYQTTMDEFNANAHEQAVLYTKNQLLMKVLVEQEGIEVTDEEINTFAEENYAMYGYETADEFVEVVGKDAFIDALAAQKMLDVLATNTTVVDLEESVEE